MTDRCSGCGQELPPCVYHCVDCEVEAGAWMDDEDWDPCADDEE